MSYDKLWKEEDTVAQLGPRLPRRVKDWPEDARKEFKRVKNELWRWHKKEGRGSGQGLGLIAYEAVKQTWECRDESPEERRRRQINEWFDKMKAFAAHPNAKTCKAANGRRIE